MSVTGSIMAGVGLAGSIGGAAISSNAAGNAADEQSQAAKDAAQLQYQASQNALDFQKQQYAQSQANLAPWLNSGAGALSNLDYLLGINPPTTQGALTGQSGTKTPTSTGTDQYGIGRGSVHPMSITGTADGTSPNSSSGTTNLGSMVNPRLGNFGSLMQSYPGGPFVAPTGLTEQNDPGYQARLQLGTDALQRSAAARGGVLTGGTAQALNQFAQDYASNEYQNVYNRAYNNYATGYNQYEQQQTNNYNRLASLAGIGQQTAQQLGTLGQGTANNVSSNLLNTASQMGQNYQNAAAANASGYVGSANAWSNAFGNTSSNLTNLMMLSNLMGGGGYGNVPTPTMNLYNAM